MRRRSLVVHPTWVVTALLLGACGSAPVAGASAESGLQRVADTTADEQRCSRDVECVLVDDCCGCAAGGTRTAVRDELLPYAIERSAGTCAQRSCPMLPSEHRSCTATAARCLGGRCVPAL